jgi:hypothetical protein
MQCRSNVPSCKAGGPRNFNWSGVRPLDQCNSAQQYISDVLLPDTQSTLNYRGTCRAAGSLQEGMGGRSLTTLRWVGQPLSWAFHVYLPAYLAALSPISISSALVAQKLPDKATAQMAFRC